MLIIVHFKVLDTYYKTSVTNIFFPLKLGIPQQKHPFATLKVMSKLIKMNVLVSLSNLPKNEIHNTSLSAVNICLPLKGIL